MCWLVHEHVPIVTEMILWLNWWPIMYHSTASWLNQWSHAYFRRAAYYTVKYNVRHNILWASSLLIYKFQILSRYLHPLSTWQHKIIWYLIHPPTHPPTYTHTHTHTHTLLMVPAHRCGAWRSELHEIMITHISLNVEEALDSHAPSPTAAG